MEISYIFQDFQTKSAYRPLQVVTEHPTIYLYARNYMDSNALT